MLYYELTVGEETYKLRLSTRNIIELEKKIGCNPLSIFGDGNTIPTVFTMVAVLHTSLLQYQHGITFNDAADIFDKFIMEKGNSVADFIPIILEIYKVSGLVSTEADTEKN